MSTITDQITSAANATAQLLAETDTTTGAESANLTSTEFLNLMLKQLEYQDPLEPQDNSEFIAQQCQFAQLQQSSELNEMLSESTTVSQALSLIGKSVALTDPDDSSQVITGTVDAVYVDGEDSAITVNGTNYSMSNLLYAYDATDETTTTE